MDTATVRWRRIGGDRVVDYTRRDVEIGKGEEQVAERLGVEKEQIVFCLDLEPGGLRTVMVITKEHKWSDEEMDGWDADPWLDE